MTTMTLEVVGFDTIRDEFVSWLDDHDLVRDGGEIASAGNLPGRKQEMMLLAMRQMGAEHVSGTRYSAIEEAGRAFWTKVYEHSRVNDVSWTRSNYHTDPVSTRQMGEWLYNHQSMFDRLTVGEPAPRPTYDWRQHYGYGTIAIPAFAPDGSIVVVVEVLSDLSGFVITDGSGDHRRRRPASILTGYVPFTTEDSFRLINGQADGRSNADNQEVWFDSVRDERSIYVRLRPDGDRNGWASLSNLRPVERTGSGQILAEKIAVTRPERIEETRQNVWFSDNMCGLVTSDDRVHDGRLRVYRRESGDWRNQNYALDSIRFAMRGDVVENRSSHQRGTYVSADSDRYVTVSVGGENETWAIEQTWFVSDAPILSTTVDSPVVTIDGVQYVRKDVIDADVAHMVETLHKGANDNGLCPVYDRTARQVDQGTTFIKMGERSRNRTVTVLETITVERRILVPNSRSEDDARRQAQRFAERNPLASPQSTDRDRESLYRWTVRSREITNVAQ